jgi:hypothetical protein
MNFACICYSSFFVFRRSRIQILARKPTTLTEVFRDVFVPGGKARPGRDADYSPPSSAEVENE